MVVISLEIFMLMNTPEESKSTKFDVFICHSAVDRGAGNLICQALENNGFSCWIAPRNVEPGTDWGGAIYSAISASSVVLIVFSDSANQSQQVVREVALAIDARKNIIPVRIDSTVPSNAMKYHLGVVHWFDAFERPLQEYLPHLVAYVRANTVKSGDFVVSFRGVSSSKRLGLLGGISIVMLAILIFAIEASKPRISNYLLSEPQNTSSRPASPVEAPTAQAAKPVAGKPDTNASAPQLSRESALPQRPEGRVRTLPRRPTEDAAAPVAGWVYYEVNHTFTSPPPEGKTTVVGHDDANFGSIRAGYILRCDSIVKVYRDPPSNLRDAGNGEIASLPTGTCLKVRTNANAAQDAGKLSLPVSGIISAGWLNVQTTGCP